MPFRDIAAWNALISAYEQNEKSKEALNIFQQLLADKSSKPNEVTLVCALSACAQLGAADMGSWIHVYIEKQCIKLNSYLCTSLIDMYSKCGDLERALDVFNSVKKKDVFTWSAMIAGHAMHGRGRAAIDIFSRMQDAGVKPNAVTLINVLSACSHAGLLEEGRFFFNEMQPLYGIKPQAEHYSCMIDILGRAGYFSEAMDLIKKMEAPYTASVWLSLLGACCLHANVSLAELAASRLLRLEPKNDGAYVLLSNVYAKSGNWDKVAKLRKLMKDSGLKKEAGCSSIEVNGTVDEFLVADNSHPMAREIYAKLDEIVSKLKTDGYVLNEPHILQVGDEESMKEQALYVHSEKLAIAFGLLCLAPPQPIRIVKNLRVCGDCHSFAKIVGVGAETTELYKSVCVKFQLEKECQFGDQILLVGDDPILGSWNPSDAIPFDWSEGHIWSLFLELPVGKPIQYKVLLKNSMGEVMWQPGPDRNFEAWETKNVITVTEEWDNAEAHKISEEQQAIEENEELMRNTLEEPSLPDSDRKAPRKEVAVGEGFERQAKADKNSAELGEEGNLVPLDEGPVLVPGLTQLSSSKEEYA
uniref:CBM20 domain-containing protein n=1 Tax=Chenopodium quinoa TaxID=63459 RepID=A0A803KRK3_CHEQI